MEETTRGADLFAFATWAGADMARGVDASAAAAVDLLELACLREER